MTDELVRDVGRHDAEIGALKKDMAEVKSDVKSILALMNQGKGGYKTLVLVAGMAGACGALVGKFLPFLK